jgi:hypothetical protein
MISKHEIERAERVVETNRLLIDTNERLKEEAGLAELEIGKLKKEIEILKYRFGEL